MNTRTNTSQQKLSIPRQIASLTTPASTAKKPPAAPVTTTKSAFTIPQTRSPKKRKSESLVDTNAALLQKTRRLNAPAAVQPVAKSSRESNLEIWVARIKENVFYFDGSIDRGLAARFKADLKNVASVTIATAY